MTPVSTIHRPNTLTDSTVLTVHQDSSRTTRSRLGTVMLRFRAGWGCVLGGVLLSRTLAGAVPSALSGLASGFGMGAGRFPVAVTTETSGMGSAVRCCLVLLIRLLAAPYHRHPVCGVVGGWVGCGPYSGRFAVSCCLPRHPYAPSLWRAGGWVWGVLFVSAD